MNHINVEEILYERTCGDIIHLMSCPKEKAGMYPVFIHSFTWCHFQKFKSIRIITARKTKGVTMKHSNLQPKRYVYKTCTTQCIHQAKVPVTSINIQASLSHQYGYPKCHSILPFPSITHHITSREVYPIEFPPFFRCNNRSAHLPR